MKHSFKAKTLASFKKIGLYSLFFIILSSFTWLLVDKYTKDEVDQIVQRISEGYHPFTICKYESNLNYDQYFASNEVEILPIPLASFLYGNADIVKKRFYGDYDAINEAYTVEFRNEICKNPDFLNAAWDMYGEYAIRQLNSRLTYYKSNNSAISDKETAAGYRSEKFTMPAFWRAEMNLLSRYKRLITELENLSDSDLSYYINSCITFDDAATFDFTKWLQSKRLIKEHDDECYLIPHEKPSIPTNYPGDLLQLINRICKDNPESLNHRSCLAFSKSMITKIQATIQKQGYVK